jgi:hypothetical protein
MAMHGSASAANGGTAPGCSSAGSRTARGCHGSQRNIDSGDDLESLQRIDARRVD